MVAAGFGVGTTDGDDQLLQEAVAAARGADHVLVFLGLPGEDESEETDPYRSAANQLVLVHALAEVHDRLIVILANGGVVRVSTWEDEVAAILECWLSGQAAGGAAVDLLLGVANPSASWPKPFPYDSGGQLVVPELPWRGGHRSVRRRNLHRLPGLRQAPPARELPLRIWALVHDFRIDDVSVSIAGSVAGGDLAATVTASVTNTGPRAGAEVVQVYVGDVEAWVVRPLRELKGFAKVYLEPGEARQVSCQLDERAFAFCLSATDSGSSSPVSSRLRLALIA